MPQELASFLSSLLGDCDCARVNLQANDRLQTKLGRFYTQHLTHICLASMLPNSIKILQSSWPRIVKRQLFGIALPLLPPFKRGDSFDSSANSISGGCLFLWFCGTHVSRPSLDPGFHWTRTSFSQGISLGSVRIPDPTSSPLLHRIGILSHLIDILFPPDRYDVSSFPSISFRSCIGIYTAGSIPSPSWYRWGGGGVVHAMPFRNRSRDFDARWRWCGS